MDWTDRAACRERDEWTTLQHRQRHPDLVEACSLCPVLADCRTFAAGHTWCDVVVAGWRAPARNPTQPPWA